MASYDLYADSTVQTSGTLTGGATLHAVLGDGSNVTWSEMWAGGGDGKVTCAAPSPPAGSRLKTVQANVAVSSISVNSTKFDLALYSSGGVLLGQLLGVQIAGTDVETWGSSVASPGDLSAAEVGDMVLLIRRSPTGAVTNLRAINAWIRAVYAEVPTTTVTTSVPLAGQAQVSWVHTAGTDGGPQRWSLAVLTGPTGVVYNSGIVDDPSLTSRAIDGLPPGTYTWSVQTAQDVGGSPHWATADSDTVVIVAGTRAEVDTVTADADPLTASVEIEITRDTAEDAWDSVDVEVMSDADALDGYGDMESGTAGLADGWVTDQIGTPTSGATSLETVGGFDGQFQRISATLDTDDLWKIARSFAVTPGDVVMMSAWLKSSTLPSGVVGRVSLSWRSAGTEIDFELSDYLVSSSWMRYELTDTAPDYADECAVQIEIVCTSGSALAAELDIDNVFAAVNGVGWSDLRVVPAPAADSLTVYDFEAPPDRPLQYRARAVKDDGTTGSWVYAAPVEWTADTAVWFKSPDRPDLNMQLCLAERPRLARPRMSHVMSILGSEDRVVRADVLNSVEWELTVETETSAEAVALLELVKSSSTLLLQFPPDYDMIGGTSHMWVSVLGVHEEWLSPVLGVDVRVWGLQVVQIGRP